MVCDLTRKVFICGVGMTRFEKPGYKPDWDYPDIVKECVNKALKDANITYNDVQQAVIGYCYGESACGQRALYEVGITGIPMFNVNNNCATGSSALFMAKQMIQSGVDCVLVVGFEKVDKASRGAFKWTDRAYPIAKNIQSMDDTHGTGDSPMGPQMFGNAAKEHMKKYGTTLEQFAKIAEKNHNHSVHNHLSQFQDSYTLKEILKSKHIYGPLTKLQCCPTSDGGAAAIVCSKEFMNTHHLKSKAVEILSLEMSTDMSDLLDQPNMLKSCGEEMVKNAAAKAYAKAHLTADDVDVVELHDCFSSNELITYEYLGLCPEGKGGEMVDNGDNTYGGKYVINPSGGLLSKGHPLGATGLAQCYELCKQLRGECGSRQVEGAVIGLHHNLGLGGACAVGLYKKVDTLNLKDKCLNDRQPVECSFKSDVLFIEIEKGLQVNKEELMKKINAVFCFELSEGPRNAKGTWFIDAKNNGKIYRGRTSVLQADCTIKMSDEDCIDMLLGKLNPQSAFLEGKIKVLGNMGLAMKLQHMQPNNLKSKL